MARCVASARCARGCAVVLLLVGCTAIRTDSPIPAPTDDPERAAAELAAGLAKKDLTAVEFVGAAGTEVNALLPAAGRRAWGRSSRR